MGKVGAVNQVAPALLNVHQAGVGQFLEVEREGAGCAVQLLGQRAGGQALGAGHHQGLEGAQALGLGQGGQGLEGLGFVKGVGVHISIILELLK